VQGVGFRYSCQRQADALGLTGWVRNCADDSVEIVAEGTESALNAFSFWCSRGPTFAHVENVEETKEPAQGDSTFFEILDDAF
jgi:acylphosphatase